MYVAQIYVQHTVKNIPSSETTKEGKTNKFFSTKLLPHSHCRVRVRPPPEQRRRGRRRPLLCRPVQGGAAVGVRGPPAAQHGPGLRQEVHRGGAVKGGSHEQALLAQGALEYGVQIN